MRDFTALQQNVPKIYEHQDDHPCRTTTVTSLDYQPEIKFKLAQYCFLLHLGLHRAKLENCPTFSFTISTKREFSYVRPVYEVKFNLREQLAFQQRLTPGEGGLGASYNRFSARKGVPRFLRLSLRFIKDREIHC